MHETRSSDGLYAHACLLSHPNIVFRVPSPPAPRMQVTKGVSNTSQLRRKGMLLARCAEICQEIQ